MSPPLHERIRTDIEARILSGALKPGDRVPIEQELARIYGCARMTVSKSVSALAAAGLVERRKRGGTIVARPRVHSMILDVPDLAAEVRARGQAHRFSLLERRIRSPERSRADERALAGAGGLLELKGLHMADEAPLAIEQRLVSLAAVPDIVGADLHETAPGTWLLRNVPWTEAETRIAAIAAQGESAALLGVAAGTACLSIERRTWRGADPVTWVRQTFLGTGYDLFARFGHEAVRDRNGAPAGEGH